MAEYVAIDKRCVSRSARLTASDWLDARDQATRLLGTSHVYPLVVGNSSHEQALARCRALVLVQRPRVGRGRVGSTVKQVNSGREPGQGISSS